MSGEDIIEKVDLHLEGKYLAKLHTFEKVTAFAVLFSINEATGQIVKIGNTLAIKDNDSPQWITPLRVDYLFKVQQEFKIGIYQFNSQHPPDDFGKHTLIGESKFILSRLLRHNGQTCELPLACSGHADGDRGHLIIHGDTVANTRDMLTITFSASKLSNKEGFFSTSDPFLIISRLYEDRAYRRVWQNYPIKNTLNPCWAETQISISQLCNGDYQCPMKIEIFDFESSGRHVFMGECNTTLQDVLSGKAIFLDVIEPEKKKKSKSYVNSGKLKINHAAIVAHPTFGDFVVGGCEISLIVGIDFTGSNGDVDMPNSLHFIDPHRVKMNHYHQAIQAVGSILEGYDTDHIFNVYGYGAKLPIGTTGQYSPVEHCFPILDHGNVVQGVEGVVRAYECALREVILSGPTRFAPLIREATRLVECKGGCTQTSQKYSILLILTDGVINDFEETKAAIVKASHHPLSIIIIGIGNEDFSEMRILDGDEKVLSYNGELARRDIVQFVPFKDFVTRGASLLAQQLLAEIPDQFLYFMRQHNITPNKIRASMPAVSSESSATASLV